MPPKKAETKTNPKKRRVEDVGDNVASSSSTKIAKVHPFFSKPESNEEGDASFSSTSFRWHEPLGPKKTLLYGTNGNPSGLPSSTSSTITRTEAETSIDVPISGDHKSVEVMEDVLVATEKITLKAKEKVKVAAFDLDGTIIEGNGRTVSASWKFWKSGVKSKLEAVVAEGYSLVIISNQGIKTERLKVWREKVKSIAAALPDVPFQLFAATAKDGFRKPMPGMWTELERMIAESGQEINKDQSFFVGDAAGRKGDFAGTDRKWALNVGIKFYTPEEYFLGHPPAKYELLGFHVSSLPVDIPPFTPTSTPLVPSSDHKPKSKGKSKPSPSPSPPNLEIVLFVGYPGVGKTTFYKRHFADAGYVHINQDVLGSKPKCLKAVEKAIEDGQRCVVDNTNRDGATRQAYISLAKKKNIPIRCCHFTGPMELAWHNNLYRAYIVPEEERRPAVPYLAFTGYRAAFEEPEVDEGFDEIRQVNWEFEGGEEERKKWGMWLQLEGS
ncbi:PNK3P-domain-containing protein [Pleurotus eryngii]|uniref:PNK3P-domain-containing protein n=1 Tax=Pleurotus eryngii TaxID=5323 RepID=A0A9P5ZS24_PLEER|nr:PNK3P-domain-containing protein [Pleurotus eryngii]